MMEAQNKKIIEDCRKIGQVYSGVIRDLWICGFVICGFVDLWIRD